MDEWKDVLMDIWMDKCKCKKVFCGKSDGWMDVPKDGWISVSLR